MIHYRLGPLLLTSLVFLWPASLHSQAPKYVGVALCKTCHSSPKVGGTEFLVWKDSHHARAFLTLAGEKAKAIAKEKGIENPQTSEKCLKCHTTAFGVEKKLLGEKFKLDDGVQCETCHGPGEKYLKLEVMKDHQKSLAAGLVIPDEKTCRTCHNPESPTFTAFDYKTAWAKIAHGKKKG